MTDKRTLGQNVPKSPDGRALEPNGLFLMDGIEGLRSLPRHSVDMLLTDPPYGTTRNYWDVPLPLIEFWEAVRWAVKPQRQTRPAEKEREHFGILPAAPGLFPAV